MDPSLNTNYTLHPIPVGENRLAVQIHSSQDNQIHTIALKRLNIFQRFFLFLTGNRHYAVQVANKTRYVAKTDLERISQAAQDQMELKNAIKQGPAALSQWIGRYQAAVQAQFSRFSAPTGPLDTTFTAQAVPQPPTSAPTGSAPAPTPIAWAATASTVEEVALGSDALYFPPPPSLLDPIPKDVYDASLDGPLMEEGESLAKFQEGLSKLKLSDELRSQILDNKLPSYLRDFNAKEALKAAAFLMADPNTFANNDMIAIGKQRRENGSVKHYGFILAKDGSLWIKGEKLGQGGSKKVSKAVEMSTQAPHIIAVTRGKDSSEGAKREQEILKTLHGNGNEPKAPHIVPIYKITLETTTKQTDTKAPEPKYIMLNPRLDSDGTALYDSAFGYRNVQPNQYLQTARGAAIGLAYMHSKGLVHSDVKPANLLIKGKMVESDLLGLYSFDPNTPLTAYVHDMGSTVQVGEAVTETTLLYQPPEAIEVIGSPMQICLKLDAKATPEADSYALGCTILQMAFPQIFTFRNIDLAKVHIGNIGREDIPVQPMEIDPKDNRILNTLSEAEVHALIKQAEASVAEESNLSPTERSCLLGLLNTAAGLIENDPSKRLSCSEAVQELERLEAAVSNPASHPPATYPRLMAIT